MCKNICALYRAKGAGSANGGRGRYKGDGQKWCPECQVYMKYDQGVSCPCCHVRLRVKRRSRSPESQRYNAVTRTFVTLTPELLASLK